MSQNFKFEQDKIVIGSGLDALLYAFTKNLPLIFNQYLPPNEFERFGTDIDLSIFGILDNDGLGIPKLQLWKRLCFSLSLAGHLPLPHNTTSIRILPEENIIEAHVSEAKKVLIGYTELIIFDARGLDGLETIEKKKEYEVLDWMNIRSGGKHDIDVLESEESFVKQINFYLSKELTAIKR